MLPKRAVDRVHQGMDLGRLPVAGNYNRAAVEFFQVVDDRVESFDWQSGRQTAAGFGDLLAQFVGHQPGHPLDVAGLDRPAMIGRRADQRRRAFDGVDPAHLRAVGLDASPIGELPGVTQAARHADQEIGVERNDQLGRGKIVDRVDRFAEGQLRLPWRTLSRASGVLMPLGLGHRREQPIQLPAERGRGDRFAQDRQAFAARRRDAWQMLGERAEQMVPGF